MRKLSRALATAAASLSLLAGTVALATPASAAAEGCGNPIKARIGLNIRQNHNTKSTILGFFPENKRGCDITPNGAEWVRGGNYEASSCLAGTDNRWVKISYRGTEGWVPIWCIVNDVK